MMMSKPSISSIERRFVEEAMLYGDIGSGPFVEKFERLWAGMNHKDYGVACNSGTNAIYLALKALGVGPGDEVIVPEYTMIATAWAVSYTGATPVFADCDDDLIVRGWPVTEKTKVIITVPIYGRFAPVPDFGIPVVEDMAEAHGIPPRGIISCYSFYGNKILTTGEGGMCLTDDEGLADEMRKLANMYFDEGRTMIHPKQGHNFRMTNLQAAVGCGQVLRFYEITEKRKMIESWYDQNLPERVKMPPRDVLWMYDIQTDHQEKLKAYMEKNGVPSRYGFKPMSMQPQYLGDYGKLNAYKWSKRVIYLPTYTDMTIEDVKHVCQTVKSFGE